MVFRKILVHPNILLTHSFAVLCAAAGLFVVSNTLERFEALEMFKERILFREGMEDTFREAIDLITNFYRAFECVQ